MCNKGFSFQSDKTTKDLPLVGLFAVTLGATLLVSRGRRPFQFHTINTNPKISAFLRTTGIVEAFSPYKKGSYKREYEGAAADKVGVFMGSMLSLLGQIPNAECSSEESPSNVPSNHLLRKQICDKIIAEQADFLISGTNLEGFCLKLNKEHLEAFTQFYADQGGLSLKTANRILQFLEGLQIVLGEKPEIANEIADKVFTLKPGETFSMEGGWSDKIGLSHVGGHSMIFAFTKRENGSYDIKLYNTGCGISDYHLSRSVTDGIKKKKLFCPYLAFAEVPPEFLGFTKNGVNPAFFKKIVSMVAGKYTEIDKNSCDLIYASPDFFGNFPGRIVKAGPGTPFITPQRAGNCSWKVLTAAIRPLFETEEEYKKFKLTLKYTDFFLFFEKVKHCLNAENKKLLIEQAAKILRSIDKCQDFFPKEKIEKMQKAIYNAQEEIAALSLRDSTAPISLTSALDQTTFGLRSVRAKSLKKVCIAKEKFFDYSVFLQKPKVKDLPDYLQKITTLEQENLRRYTTEELGKTLLEFSDADWSSLSKKEMVEVVQLLCTNLQLYLNQERSKTFNGEMFFTEKSKSVAWSFLAIAYKLGCVCYPPLANYNITHRQLDQVYPFLPRYSPKEVSQWKKINSLFMEGNNLKKLFDFEALNHQLIDLRNDLPTDVVFLWKIACPDCEYKPSVKSLAALISWKEPGDIIPSFKADTNILDRKLAGNLRGIAFLAHLSSAKSYYDPISNFVFYGRLSSTAVQLDLWSIREWDFSTPDQGWINPAFFSPKKENDFLLRRKIELALYFDEFSWSLALRTTEETLRCALLLYQFQEKGFNYTNEQAELFIRLLFQPHQDPSKDPYIFTALKDPVFEKQLTDFLIKGIEFSDIHKNGSFDKRFLYLQICWMVKEINPKALLPSFRDQINKWLKDPKDSIENKRQLHLQRILQYKSRDPDTLSSDELEEIVQSWLVCSQYFFSEKIMDSIQKKEASSFIFKIAPQLQKISDESLNHVLCYALGIIKENMVDLDKGAWNTTAFPICQKGAWKIDLLEGTLKENGLQLGIGSKKKFTDSSRYAKIFGNRVLSFEKEGDIYEFRDETGLIFRIVSEEVQVYFNEKWHEYEEDVGLVWPKRGDALYDYFATAYDIICEGNETFPLFLLSNHHCFSVGTAKVFLDKKTLKPAFVLQEDGQLINYTNQNRIAYARDVKTPALDAFEHSGWRIYEQDAKGRTIIQFPRYKTSSGSEIRLIKTSSGQIVLEENPNFFLIPPVKGIIGGIKNILCFYRSKTEEIKLFVPMTDEINEFTLAPADSLNIPDSSNELNLEFSIAEYTYKKGLIPKDREAKTFLIFLYLIQKREKEACALLESLGREINITTSIEKNLNRIVFTPIKGSNRTPSAIAVALKTSLFFLRNGKSLKDKESKSKDVIKDLISSYRNIYDSIPATLRLTERELEEFVRFGYEIEYREEKKSDSFSIEIKQKHFRTETGHIGNISDFEFKNLYRILAEVETVGESRAVLAGIQMNKFKEDLQEIFLKIQAYRDKTGDLVLPPFPDLSSFSIEYNRKKEDEWKSQFQAPPYKDLLIYSLVPGDQRKSDPELSMHKGKPLRSLQQALLQIQTPTLSKRPLTKSVIDFPKVDLHRDCVIPYFKKVQFEQREKTPLLALPQKASPLHVKAISRVNQEIAIGRKINIGRTSWILQKGQNLDSIKEKLRNILREFEISLVQSKQAILDLASENPDNIDLAERSFRLEKGGYKRPIEFEELITHYLRGDYQTLNPHLRKDQQQELDQKIEQFLVQVTKAQQIERATQETEIPQVAAILDAEMSYSPTKKRLDRVCLVYEYRAGLRIRKEQRDAIANMLESKDVVQQMIMGGGKTTVLTAILLEMVDPEKISIFIPPASQFNTQVENLSEMQGKYFFRQIIPMNYTKKDLSLVNLQKIERQLKEAKKHHETIVTTPFTFPSLQLEWMTLLDKSPILISHEERKKIELLTNILGLLKQDGCALIDEVDQILDPLKELNFSIGDKQSVDSAYIDFIQKIFALHLDPKVESVLGLIKNEQASFSTQKYKEEILPIIIDHFFDKHYDLFQLDASWKESCKKYVFEGVETPEFRKILEKRLEEQDFVLQKATQLIFLAKGLFTDLLPSVMSKVENKNFGIAKQTQERRVIPFIGVDSPASTEFAGPFETICYHYLACLSNPITILQLKRYGNKLLEAALESIKQSKKPLVSTKEASKFLYLTGVSLERVLQEDETAWEEAIEHLRKHPLIRLELEKDFIQEYVGTYGQYYRSNPQSFCNLFFSNKAFSGTLWNVLTYPEKLRKNVHLEEGTEGRIRDVFLTRVDQGECRVYRAKTESVHEMLDAGLRNNPKKERFRALLDPAGNFKYTQNTQVAKEILTYFKDDQNVQGVLFFGRTEGNMGVPNTLMIMKKTRGTDGDFLVEIVGGTTKESLDAKGIDPTTTITYYDERHCEATDIPQIPEALGLITVDSRLLDRDFLQTDLRLRKYLETQDIDLLVLEKELKNYPDSLTGRDILMQMEIAQKELSAEQGFTSFRQKTDEVFRQIAVEALMSSPNHQLMAFVRDLVVVKQDFSPYGQFGKLEEKIPPLEGFDQYSRTKEGQYNRILTELSLDRSAAVEIALLRRGMQENIEDFASLVPASITNLVNGTELVREQQREQKIELKKALELEYQRHQWVSGFSSFEQIPWNLSERLVIQKRARSKKGPEIIPLSDVFSLNRVDCQNKNYPDLFGKGNVFLSENFIYTENEALSVFSTEQKSAEQILITEDENGIKALLLSMEEGRDFKREIENGLLPNTWLYLPDGHMFVSPMGNKELKDQQKLKEILLEVNLFNGNGGYLISHKEELLEKIGKKNELIEALLSYISLKAYKGKESEVIKILKDFFAN